MSEVFKSGDTMSFSERYGYKEIKSLLQVETVDTELRNSLWNALHICYWNQAVKYRGHAHLKDSGNEFLSALCDAIWLYFYKEPLDSLPVHLEDVLKIIKKRFYEREWFEVYDFLEFVPNHFPRKKTNEEFMFICNGFMEREVSAYRFVNNKISKITTEEEISAIEEAQKIPNDPVRKHLVRALELLSDRKSPDYRNSIKESISAVEAMVKSVSGGAKGTLGQLLNQLEHITNMHPAIKTAFSSLYGYTSDANGIRHALTDKDTISFEEAKFMLVACSAFVNYVIGILNK